VEWSWRPIVEVRVELQEWSWRPRSEAQSGSKSGVARVGLKAQIGGPKVEVRVEHSQNISEEKT